MVTVSGLHTRSDADSSPGVPHHAVIISFMADKSAGSRPPRQRIKTLTQAAMNADVTVGQLEGLLGGLGDTLTDLNISLSNLNGAVDRLDGGLDHFEATLSRIDDLMKRLVTLVAPVEAIVERIDYMVSVGETVMSPLSVTEHAVRNVFNSLRNRTAR
jgi:ABC-type transporter Mla subunit MlaD